MALGVIGYPRIQLQTYNVQNGHIVNEDIVLPVSNYGVVLRFRNDTYTGWIFIASSSNLLFYAITTYDNIPSATTDWHKVSVE